jgi:hypothetical protein
MHACTGTSALAAALIVATFGVVTRATAQEAPPANPRPHFALFGGRERGGSGPESGLELGASGDFRVSALPVPLRLSLSFSENNDGYDYRPQRGGKAALDLVLRPIPRVLGIRPYFLTGLGVSTHAPYTRLVGGCYFSPDVPCVPYSSYSYRRETWTFLSAGAGLDVGPLFVQLKWDQPVASQGPVMTPINIGFRFWD